MSGLKKTHRLSQALLASSVLMMPSLAFADTTYPPDAAVTQVTSATGNITIQANGKIQTAVGDAVQVNTGSTFVVIEANNQNPEAIKSAAAIGVNITATGNNALIVNNVGSEIEGATAAIQINATTAAISNAGDINSTAGPAIDITATGVNAEIFNDSTGTIESVGGAGILINGTGLELNNSGLITANDANFSTIIANASFTSITNNESGEIIGKGTNLAAISLNTAGITGEIINSGLISHDGTNAGIGDGIAINQDFDGSILNTATGIIRTESQGAGAAIFVNGSFNEINNDGLIEGTNANGGGTFGILVNGTFAGTINNDGTIQIVGSNQPAILAVGGLTDIFNTGTITADGTDPTIQVTAGSFTGAITNTGTISNTGTGEAIDLSTAGDVLLNQNGGTITGDILLAGLTADQNVALNMNGGTINGDVFSSATKATTVNLNGGTLNGDFKFQFVAAVGTENILNLDGTTVNGTLFGSLFGADIFNLSGGSFTTLDAQAGLDTINIIDDFTLTGTITDTVGIIDNLNVQNAGTVFTVANTGVITRVANINIDPSTTMTVALNGTINTTLALTNDGTLNINGGNVDIDQVTNNARLNITSLGQLNVNAGGFTQNAGGSYHMQIVSDTQYGKIDVQGGTATVDGTINPYLGTAGTFFQAGDKFDVIETTGGLIDNGYVLVQPPSALVFFTDTSDANTLQLTVGLNSISSLGGLSDIAIAVGTALDPLFFGGTNNPEFQALFGQLQLLPSATELNLALEQLAPPFNYAPVAIAHIAMDNAFDSVQIRLEWLKGVFPLTQDGLYRTRDDEMLYNGVSYGDGNLTLTATVLSQIDTNIYHQRGEYGGWAKLYGTYIEEMKRIDGARNLTVDGWTVESTGYAIGFDWQPTDCFLFGVAGSFTKSSSTDETAQENTIDLESIMGTFYTWYQISEHFYLDGMVGIATHEYDMERNIAIGNIALTAEGQPYGFQYGGQIDLGYAFSSDGRFIAAPYARAKYTILNIGNYTEIGAGALNLQVENEPVHEEILGLGFRVAVLLNYIDALYVPEASAMILYDFAGESQETQSIFMGGTPPFYTNSIEPEKFIQMYSVGISAYTSDRYAFTLKLNFEHRENYFAYNGFMQLNYSWG